MASEQPCLANSLNCFNKDFYYLGEQQADIQSDIYLCVEAQSSNVNGEFGVDCVWTAETASFLFVLQKAGDCYSGRGFSAFAHLLYLFSRTSLFACLFL